MTCALRFVPEVEEDAASAYTILGLFHCARDPSTASETLGKRN